MATWMDAYQRWRPGLVEALDPRFYTGEWLDHVVMSGRVEMLHGERCAVVAEVTFYPTGAKDLSVICATGEAEALRDEMVPALVTWAERAGCLSIVVSSREAWSRLLREAGFGLYKTTLRKDL